MKISTITSFAALLLSAAAMAAPSSLIWTIGTEDGSSAEFALDASRLDDFKKNDFFFEDHFFVIGHSDAKVDFPFLQAGITDAFDGGCSADPVYEIVSPLYPRTTIHLGGRYGRGQDFVIEAHNASPDNIYVRKAVLNGRELSEMRIPASELLKGGKLELWMVPEQQ